LKPFEFPPSWISANSPSKHFSSSSAIVDLYPFYAESFLSLDLGLNDQAVQIRMYALFALKLIKSSFPAWFPASRFSYASPKKCQGPELDACIETGFGLSGNPRSRQ
jgi:hypothetical protein